MSNDFKWAAVGDLQIPYEDQRAVALWMKVMKAWKPDAIDILGDIDDQLEYSSFSDGTTDEFFSLLKKEEDPSPIALVKKNADGAKRFYAAVRKQHPNTDIHVSLGNHDVRIFKYIDKKSPGYKDEITPNSLWGLDDLGMSWKMYGDKPHLRFADVYVHHGVTVSTTGPTISKDIDEYGISLMRGHSHRAQIAFKTFPIPGKTLHGMEAGHMCDINAYGLQYTINPQWQLGFGLVHITDGAHVKMEFVPISPDYTCVVDGKVFRG